MLGMLLAGCAPGSSEDGGTRLVTEARPKPPPPPPPPPPLTPVDGAIVLGKLDASDPENLGFRDDGRPDNEQAQTVARTVADALNAYLDAVQAGAPDLTLLDGDWAERPGGPDTAPLTTLATRENPISSASYDIVVQFEGEATLASALVQVVRLDGTTASVDLAFDVAGATPSLLLFSGGAA